MCVYVFVSLEPWSTTTLSNTLVPDTSDLLGKDYLVTLGDRVDVSLV